MSGTAGSWGHPRSRNTTEYVRDYEAEKVLQALGIEERDATAAVKASTYMHNLTHPLGEITEMTPQKSMRVEKYCPFAGLLSPGTCKELISGPAFRGLCEAINPNLVTLTRSTCRGEKIVATFVLR